MSEGCRESPARRPGSASCDIVEVACTKPGSARNVFLTYAVGGRRYRLRFTRTDRGLEILDIYRACGIARTDLADLRGARVLDAGAGHGLFVLQLILSGIDARGLDLFLEPWQRDRRTIRRCLDNLAVVRTDGMRPLPPEDLFCEGSVTDPPFGDASFDVISSFAVFHFDYHGDAVAQALRAFVRITRPGGRILIAPFHARFVPCLERLERSHPSARVAHRARYLGRRDLQAVEIRVAA